MADYSGGCVMAEHLCVLVHGLWGEPKHMANVARRLRAEYPADKLYILLAKRNAGSFTYDGIEIGGERVCHEIEEELARIRRRGGNIKKISIAGYSLGGCVARYAIGLLYAKGILDELECQTFTAFASPFLGVRQPRRGWTNDVFNMVGARSLSQSGRELFTIDTFRDTGKPLLAVLTDPQSIFMKGLAKFKRRVLYTNIINDRSAVYYTTGISKTDPYADLSKVKLNYLEGYENVILDPHNPHSPLPANHPRELDDLANRIRVLVQNVPFFLVMSIFVPIGIIALIATASVQTVCSAQRIQLHERGLAGVRDVAGYRGAHIVIEDIRNQIEETYEELNSSQQPEYLSSTSDNESVRSDRSLRSSVSSEQSQRGMLERRHRKAAHPTLALTGHQFNMISALDKLGWRKYPVYIKKVRHTHAAIIVRMNKPSFSEGEMVLKHWIKDEFLL